MPEHKNALAQLFDQFVHDHCHIEQGCWVDFPTLHSAFFWYCNCQSADAKLLEYVWGNGSVL